MRNIFILALLICGNLKAQSPLSFTLSYMGYQNTITCNNTSVVWMAHGNYTLAPVSYSWTNGSAVYNGSMVTITAPGNYSVTAYTSSPGMSLTSVFPVASNTVAPSSTLSPFTQSIGCTNPNALITATSTVMYPIHYFVSPTGGTMSVSNPVVNYAPAAPGTYTHVLIDSLSGCRTQKTFTVTAPSGFPTFSLTSAQNFTVGCGTKSVATVSITQASSSPPNSSLSYTITSTPAYVTGNLTTYTFANAGTYTVVVKDNVTGCETKVPVSILTNTLVDMPFGTNFYGTINCRQKSLHMKYYQIVPGNFSFGWGTAGFPSSPVLNHPYDTLTVFSDPTPGSQGFWGPWAMLTNNDNACQMTSAYFIDQDLAIPTASINTNYNPITCAHPKPLLTFQGQSTSGSWLAGPVLASLWQGPSPMVSGTLSSGYLATTGGIYTVTAVDYGNGCSNTATIQINDIRSVPQVSAPSTVFNLCSSPRVLIQPVVSSAVPLKYTWQTIPNANTSTLAPYQLLTNLPGVYTVVATNSVNSCSVSVQLTVAVCVGMEDQQPQDISFSVYPNPFSSSLWLESGTAEHIVITDALSKVIMVKEVEAGKTNLDLSSLVRGIYFIQVNGTGNPHTIKIVKND